jgi:glycine cleavage system aminomethyltransferase T
VIRELNWLGRHQGDYAVSMVDVTASEGVLAIMGPNARKLMERVAPWADWSNESHPFGMARTVEIGFGHARAHRVSYVGELGWELYIPTDQCAHLFETIIEQGADLGLTLCGLHAMDSLRIEKGFRHFGHDITEEDHVLEAGLGFAVKTAKPGFIGRDAVLRKKEEGLRLRMLQFRLVDPQPLLHHAEPIFRDGVLAGYLTSGNYGHTLGSAIGLGYVPCEGEKPDMILASRYEIEIAGERFAAEASLKPFYDPTSVRMKA